MNKTKKVSKIKSKLNKVVKFVAIIEMVAVGIGQEIHDLPNQAVFLFPPDTNNIYSAFEVQHDLSESLYSVGKIVEPIPDSFPPTISSTDFWPEGSWGRGYYTFFVEYHPESTISKYNTWYNGKWGCYPLIRDVGRRIIGYVNAMKNTHYPTDYENLGVKVKDGIEYLLSEQSNNGGFNWYPFRESFTGTENSDVEENVYPTSIALRALCEGYDFLNEVLNDPTLNIQIINGIEIASTWLIDYNLDIPGYNHGNINMKYHAVWGLVGAYKITGNTTYYNTAKAIALTLDLV